MIFIIYLLSFSFATIQGGEYAECTTPLSISEYPYHEIIEFDENKQYPGICGEDEENIPSIWIKLENPTSETQTYSIKVNSSLALHTMCEIECIDILPSETTITIVGNEYYYIVLKGHEFVDVSIELLSTSDSENPIAVPILPFSKEFVPSEISTLCSGETKGVMLAIPDMANLQVTLDTCDSTTGSIIVIHANNECIVPTTELCPNGNGFIATFIGQPMTIELLTSDEIGFNDGVVSVHIEYSEVMKCENAKQYKINDEGSIFSSTIFAGTAKSNDICDEKNDYSYDFVEIHSDRKEDIYLNLNKEVDFVVHIFQDCEMTECIDSLKGNGKEELRFELDLTVASFFVKIGVNADENIVYSLHLKADEAIDDVTTGMYIFIACFILVVAVLLIVGIICIGVVIVKAKRKTGYHQLE